MAIDVKPETANLLGPEAIKVLEAAGFAEAWHQRGKDGITFYFGTTRRFTAIPLPEPLTTHGVRAAVEIAIERLGK